MRRSLADGLRINQMIIEDYASIYFETLQGRSTPPVYDGKFVHISGPREEFLVLSPVALSKYHANIVERFCHRHKDVMFRLSGDDGRFTTPGWEVCGGGRFHLDHVQRFLQLWGTSKAYGAFDAEALRIKAKSVTGWTEYTIRLGEPA